MASEPNQGELEELRTANRIAIQDDTSTPSAIQNPMYLTIDTKEHKKVEEWDQDNIGEMQQVEKDKSSKLTEMFTADSMASASPVISSLWDEAYDMVKSQAPQQIQFYEKVIELCLKAESSILPARLPMIDQEAEDFVFFSPSERQHKTSKIISSCLDSNGNNISKDVNQQLGMSKLARDIIKSVVCNLEDAAIPWAGLCLCLQNITDPEESDEITSSLTYIVSRMAWYNILPTLLHSGAIQNRFGKESSHEKHALLRMHIINLYREIILCEVRIICHQYGHPLERLLSKPGEDSPFLGETLCKDVINAESSLACFSTGDLQSQMLQLINSTNEKLGKGDVTIQPEGLERSLKLLNAIDPRKDAPKMFQYGDSVLEPLYQWLSSTEQYRRFDTARLLWISGPPATGTKMMMRAIVQEYLPPKHQIGDIIHISFSFGCNGQLRTEDATSIVKSIIYLVQYQQPKLAKHLVNHCTETKRKHAFDSNDMYALSMILCNMVKDESFVTTLFLIDGIDEVGGGLDEIGSVLDLIDATLNLSSKVKWLLSSDALNEYPKVLERLKHKHYPSLNLEEANIAPIFEQLYTASKIDELAHRYSEDFRSQITSKLRTISVGNVLQVDMTCEALKRVEPWHANDMLHQLSSHNIPLYTLMKRFIEGYVKKDRDYCSKVLEVMAGVYRPLHITELRAIVDFPQEVDIKFLIEKKCFAFLQLCGDTVCFTERTARNFIQGDLGTANVEPQKSILQRCLYLISTFLSRNAHDAEDAKSIKYPILFWMKHLVSMENPEQVVDIADMLLDFLMKHHLQWQSCLASFGWLPQASSMLRELESHIIKLYPSHTHDSVQNLLKVLGQIKQAFRFQLLSQNETLPNNLNTLLFHPKSSVARQEFLSREFTELIVPPATDDQWGHVVHLLEGHTDYVRCCAFSCDGKHLVSGSDDGSICIWNTETGKLQHKIPAFNHYVYLIVLSSKGLLAASDGRNLKMWNTNTNTLVDIPDGINLLGTSRQVDDLAFSHDGSLLAVASSGTITIWNIAEYSKVALQWTPISSIQFSKDNLLATISHQGVSVWELDSEYEEINEPAAKNEAIFQDVRLYGLKRLRDFPLPDGIKPDFTSKVAFSPDSKYIAAGTQEVYIWDCKSGTMIAILSGHTDEICGLSFSHDALFLASSSRDRTARVWTGPWEGNDKKPLLTLTEHSGAVFGLSFSPSQKLLATCSGDETLRIWDYETGMNPDVGAKEEEDQHTSVHKRPICMVSTSHDGDTIASGSEDGLICLWEGKTGILRREVHGHEDFIRCINFSQDSKVLVSTSDDETVRVWDAYDESKSLTLRGHESWVRCAIFSPDGRFVVSCSDDRTLRVWDLTQKGDTEMTDSGSAIVKHEDEEEVVSCQVLQGHDDYIMCAAFSSDGKYLVSGANNGQILLWDFSEAQQNLSLTPRVVQNADYDPISSLALVDNSKHLIASTSTGLAIWDVDVHPCELKKKAPSDVTIYTLYPNEHFPEYIITGIGPILIETMTDNEKVQIQPTNWSPFGFSPGWFDESDDPEERWITWMGKRLILLPKIHRPTWMTAHGHTVIIGCQSGRLLYFKSKEDADFRNHLASQ
ncbi:WD_REPEATS_REGION domain-containing protein [Trichoderma simmonsii]|uniref:Mitochondrial division protein 1 n=1 Tax=Trichoderma simmonsii TaxID=1491479 RepID=A0A8G0PKA1_9HYPO|nr:WD_REPEATS_REGION domain-containing protein [Trichoderma simmonsii]